MFLIRKQKIAIVFLFIIIFVSIKILTINEELLWDETVYLGMGKYLYSYGKSGLWESIRPLGLPIITGFMWVFGEQILLTKILLIILSVLLIYITYLTSYLLSSNKRTATITVLLLIITPIFIDNSSKILTEIPSTFFMILGIYLLIKYEYQKKIMVLSGFLFGISFLFKFPVILSGIGVIITFIYNIIYDFINTNRKSTFKNKKHYTKFKNTEYKQNIYRIFLFLLGIAISITPFLIFNYFMYIKYMSFLKAIFWPIISGSLYQNNYFQNILIKDFSSATFYILYYIMVLIKNNILLLLFLPGIFIINNKKYNIIKLTLISILIYLTIISYKQERFIIFILPLICIIASQVITNIYEHSLKKRLSIKKLIFKIIFYTIIIIITYFSIANIYSKININSINESEQKNNNDFINNLQKIKGPILITNPKYTIYTDERIIPIYNVIDKEYYLKKIDDLYVNPWEKNIEINSAIYDPSGFPCENLYYDTPLYDISTFFICKDYKKEIEKYLSNNKILIYQFEDIKVYTKKYSE